MKTVKVFWDDKIVTLYCNGIENLGDYLKVYDDGVLIGWFSKANIIGFTITEGIQGENTT